MKLISVETQKRIMYIPYINILNIFFWLYNSTLTKQGISSVLKTLSVMFINALPLMILQVIMTKVHAASGEILAYINTYLIPLLISRAIIKYQQ